MSKCMLTNTGVVVLLKSQQVSQLPMTQCAGGLLTSQQLFLFRGSIDKQGNAINRFHRLSDTMAWTMQITIKRMQTLNLESIMNNSLSLPLFVGGVDWAKCCLFCNYSAYPQERKWGESGETFCAQGWAQRASRGGLAAWLLFPTRFRLSRLACLNPTASVMTLKHSLNSYFVFSLTFHQSRRFERSKFLSGVAVDRIRHRFGGLINAFAYRFQPNKR
jgi:hypothetical protein